MAKAAVEARQARIEMVEFNGEKLDEDECLPARPRGSMGLCYPILSPDTVEYR
jgi:hypothetical protein